MFPGAQFLKKFPIGRLLFSLVVLCGGLLFTFITSKIYGIQFLGYSEDAAGYAEIADSMIQGRGMAQDFIDFYFQRLDTISHRTQHWFSFYSLLLTPLFLLFGKNAFVVKIISTVSYFVLGLVLFQLVKLWFNHTIATATALAYYFHPTPLYLATQGLPDLLFALCLISALFFFHTLDTKKSSSIWLGVSLACGFMTKATFLLLIMILIGASLLYAKRTVTRRMLGSLLLMVLILTPLLGFNLATSGQLFPSDHIYLMCQIGYGENILEDHYAVIWDTPEPHYLQSLVQQGASAFGRRFLIMARSLLSGQYYAEGGLGLLEFTLFPLCLLVVPGLAYSLPPVVRFISLSIIMVWFLFFTLIFTPTDRYFVPLLLMILMLSFRGLEYISEKLSSAMNSPPTLKTILFIMVLGLIFFLETVPTLKNFYQRRVYNPYDEMIFSDRQTLLPVFEDIKTSTQPQETIMVLLPATVHYYTDRQTVPIPYEGYEKVREVISHYQVDYFLDLYPRRLYLGKNALPMLQVMKRWQAPGGQPIMFYKVNHQDHDADDPPLWSHSKGFLYNIPDF
ncbi:ArnT family glycosyltransferase [candidate division CSSED10-310 bacterium]|uniref:ArnT family glycosyltransferase n=1 Tax=candidate division CSSED10-310 bacterium TaxID=2855610 RepID=A0ABV6Z632_UNCC1